MYSPRILRAGRDAIIAQCGPWAAHDIALGDGVSTMDDGLHHQWRVDFFTGLIQRSSNPADRMRLLDLGCMEGLFAIEFARQGMETVGIEIDEQYLIKARFVQSVLELTNCSFVQADARKIPDELGQFDIALAAGILHHFDFPDCVQFVQAIAGRSRDLVIVDSHLAYDDIESLLPVSSMRTYEHAGRTFAGREYIEQLPRYPGGTGTSLREVRNVWLSEAAVVDIFGELKFALVQKEFPDAKYQRANPDRPTLVFKRTG